MNTFGDGTSSGPGLLGTRKRRGFFQSPGPFLGHGDPMPASRRGEVQYLQSQAAPQSVAPLHPNDALMGEMMLKGYRFGPSVEAAGNVGAPQNPTARPAPIKVPPPGPDPNTHGGLTQDQLAGLLYNEQGPMRGPDKDAANLAIGYTIMNRQANGVHEKFGGEGKTLAPYAITNREKQAIEGGYPPAVEAYQGAQRAADFLFNAPGAFPPPGNYGMFNHRPEADTGPWQGKAEHPHVRQYGPFSGSNLRYTNIYK